MKNSSSDKTLSSPREASALQFVYYCWIHSRRIKTHVHTCTHTYTLETNPSHHAAELSGFYTHTHTLPSSNVIANVNREAERPARIWGHGGNAISSVWSIMIDDEGETKTEWIGVKKQVRRVRHREAWQQRKRGKKNSNSDVIASRSIWSWSEITACDDKYWFDKTTEAQIWADMNTARVERSSCIDSTCTSKHDHEVLINLLCTTCPAPSSRWTKLAASYLI